MLQRNIYNKNPENVDLQSISKWVKTSAHELQSCHWSEKKVKSAFEKQPFRADAPELNTSLYAGWSAATKAWQGDKYGHTKEIRVVGNPNRNNYLYQYLHAANQMSSPNDAFVGSTCENTQQVPSLVMTELVEYV